MTKRTIKNRSVRSATSKFLFPKAAKKKRRWLSSACLLAGCLAISLLNGGCIPAYSNKGSVDPDSSAPDDTTSTLMDQQSVSMEQSSPEPGQRSDSILVTVTGDVLLEDAFLNYFGSGPWTGYTDALDPWFKGDDLTIANQEVVIGGENLGIQGSNYCFNAPASTAGHLKDAGIEFVSLANNHAYDRGLQGIARTHENLDTAGIGYTGTNTSEEASNELKVIEKNGLKIGLLSYTYGCNIDPSDAPWAVNIYGYAQSPQAQQMLEQAADAATKCDALLVSIHWGTEFTTVPNADQEVLSQALADAGADVIIGNHPHCIQPAKWLTSDDGRNVLCFYSLGNLISAAANVDRASEAYTNLYEVGAIAQFMLCESDGTLQINDVQIIPVINHFENDYSSFALMPLKNYSEELAARHDQRQYSDGFTWQILKSQVHDVFDPSGIFLDLD